MKNWVLKENNSNIGKMSEYLNSSTVFANILANRGIITPRKLKFFLNGDKSGFYDTWKMKDFAKGFEIICKAIENKEKISIYGDYDADGINSTVILYKALKRCGAEVIYYIPDRESEGYGMNVETVHKLSQIGIELIFTCDNGIACFEEIEQANKLGMKVVVLDHHDVRCDEDGKELLPKAEAVIDPKRSDCEYPFKQMCAGGLAYKFAVELYKYFKIPLEETDIFLPYAAIATICDIVDLQEENRIIVKEGLKLIKETTEKGLRALLEATELINNENVGVYHIGFIVGPCINATGRLEQATIAVELFTCEDENRAKSLAAKLVELNNSRKEMTKKAVERAVQNIEKIGLGDNKVLVIYDEEIHESIAGIVAGRIKELYYLPTIVLTKGEKFVKGSARSIEAYNIFEELCKCQELFEKFGGHPMAAGMSLKYENVDKLRKKLNDLCILTEEDLIPNLFIDSYLPIEEISFDLLKELNFLAPYGRANEEPVFAQKSVIVKKVDFIGKNKNFLKMQCICNDDRTINAMSFDGYDEFKKMVTERYGKDFFEEMQKGAEYRLVMDIAYTVNINEFNGNKSLQMMLKDFKFSN